MANNVFIIYRGVCRAGHDGVFDCLLCPVDCDPDLGDHGESQICEHLIELGVTARHLGLAAQNLSREVAAPASCV